LVAVWLILDLRLVVLIERGDLEHLDDLLSGFAVGQWHRNGQNAPVVGGADLVLDAKQAVVEERTKNGRRANCRPTYA
jgi:hypothetical protein